MHRVLVALLLLVPYTSQAQTPTDIAAVVTVRAFLFCTVAQGFDFGNHLPGVGTVVSTATNFGEVECRLEFNNERLDVSFSLPTVLVNGPHTVPITFGTKSALVQGGNQDRRFNPVAGITGYRVTNDELRITLGGGTSGDPKRRVAVDLSNGAAGTYTAVIVVTVSISS